MVRNVRWYPRWKVDLGAQNSAATGTSQLEASRWWAFSDLHMALSTPAGRRHSKKHQLASVAGGLSRLKYIVNARTVEEGDARLQATLRRNTHAVAQHENAKMAKWVCRQLPLPEKHEARLYSACHSPNPRLQRTSGKLLIQTFRGM